MKVTFLGAAGTVTGSKTLLETDRARVLVDCGLFQGIKNLRLRNWSHPGFDPSRLDAIVLTHAHIDHSGYLPRLWTAGFRGRVLCTPGTRDLLRILLPDSGWLQEEEARHANRWGWSKHRPALPLYTRADADASLSLLEAVPYGTTLQVTSNVRATFSRAGHIVGAACVRVEHDGRSLTFTGDVGRPHDPIMRPPAPLAHTSALVVESTYGDRRHPQTDLLDELAATLRETFDRGGAVVVPAFAVGRAQHMLHAIAILRRAGRIPIVPVYLDSPMAIDATRVFFEHAQDHRLTENECAAMCRVARQTNSPEESKAIDAGSGPMIVVSASGMATGGRVLHHLKRFLPDRANTILLVGFQAAGTRGRALLDGVEEIKIHGDYYPVRARVAQIQGLSAHADWAELLDWLEASDLGSVRAFVNHGEPAASDAMRRRLVERFGWSVTVAEQGASFEL